jgi:hypothetical protein
MMMSYAMRMTDPREAGFLAGHQTGMVDGMSYDGNAGWLNGIVRSGGADFVASMNWGAVLLQRTLNVKGICDAMQCPEKMTQHERYMFVRDMESLYDKSKAENREYAAWIVTDNGKFKVGPSQPGLQGESDFPLMPDGAIAKFHTHPPEGGVPGSVDLSGADWATWDVKYGYGIWQGEYYSYIRPNTVTQIIRFTHCGEGGRMQVKVFCAVSFVAVLSCSRTAIQPSQVDSHACFGIDLPKVVLAPLGQVADSVVCYLALDAIADAARPLSDRHGLDLRDSIAAIKIRAIQVILPSDEIADSSVRIFYQVTVERSHNSEIERVYSDKLMPAPSPLGGAGTR